MSVHPPPQQQHPLNHMHITPPPPTRRYEGAFENDRPHGEGTLYTADGAVAKRGWWKVRVAYVYVWVYVCVRADSFICYVYVCVFVQSSRGFASYTH